MVNFDFLHLLSALLQFLLSFLVSVFLHGGVGLVLMFFIKSGATESSADFILWLKLSTIKSNDKYLLKKTSFDNMVSLVIDAVPPPFCPPLVENKKLKFGGEASVRTTGASVPSHVPERRMLPKLLSKITSFMLKEHF